MARLLADIRALLVPVDGSDASYTALDLACDIARRSKATVHLLHIIEVPRSLALDAPIDAEIERGEAILARAERIAEGHGLKVEGDLLQARQAGHAVVDEAVDRHVDAIVLGVEYHRPLGKFELGRVPQYVLEHAPAQVWLIRYPSDDPARRR